jgi:hypothetical protein
MPDSTQLLTRSGLDLDLAVFLAEASDMAYKPSIIVKAWIIANGLGAHSSCFDRENIQGYWCSNGEVALLAFRGTSNPGQWIRDLRILPVSHPWGSVHAGFRSGIDIAELDLTAFEAVAKTAKHVWITGHSLGGALAVMAAARMKIHGIDTALYTYGQPRVGLGNFAQYFLSQLPENLIRFVNQSDIVPRVPPGLIYRHFGTVKHIVPGALEGIDSMLDDEELPPLSEEEFAVLQESLNQPGVESFEGSLPWISDHSITEYVRLLTDIRG